MKCPNCSFINSDELLKCKVCGFELSVNHAAVSASPPKKARIIDKDEEEALDSAFKTLFGLDHKEDDFDVASVKKMLKQNTDNIASKAHIENLDHPPKTDLIYDNVKNDDLDEEPFNDSEADMDESHVNRDTDLSETDNDSNISIKFFIGILVIAILVLIVTKSGLIDFKWGYKTDNIPEHLITTNPTQNTELAIEDPEFNLGDSASLTPINAFFTDLPSFVNKGNMSLLSNFQDSQEALEILTEFAVVGNFENYIDYGILASTLESEGEFYQIRTTISRLIDGEQKQVPIFWDFRVILKDNLWVIESISFEANPDETVGETTTAPATTEAPTKPVQTTEATTSVATTEVETTENATEADQALEGFINSGSFSGGTFATGQDIAVARFGIHEDFDRLVFEIYEFAGIAKPTKPVEVITSYASTLSEDGTLIQITLKGAYEAYASQSSIDYKGKTSVKSVTFSNSPEGDAITISISLSQPSQYKVFSLKSPGKLVIDFAPRP